jgi:CheY-like chemotaxis protein
VVGVLPQLQARTANLRRYEMSVPVIAVVNDDSAFLHLMHQLLTDEGYETILHTVGSTAYEMIKERKPDLVVLDIRMDEPGAGWLVLDLMRLDPETASIPVIVCTADALQLREKQDQLAKYNASSLEKPFELQDLLDLVVRYVDRPPQK